MPDSHKEQGHSRLIETFIAIKPSNPYDNFNSFTNCDTIKSSKVLFA